MSNTQSALAVMATRLQCDTEKLLGTLKNTVFKGANNEELMALCVVANSYGLNPFTKEVYAFPAKGGGVVPVVSVDGWLRIINSQPQLDGIQFSDLHENGALVATTCRIYRKDRTHPIEITEYLSECRRATEPWKMEHRMLRHKALIQCARVAFGFSGIYDEDEGERITHAQGRVVPQARVPAAPAFLPMSAQAAGDADEYHIPMHDTPPPRRGRPPKAKPEAESFALSDAPEDAVEKLARKIREDGLDMNKAQEWLDAAGLPSLDAMLTNEAERVLAEYDMLKEVAK